MQTLINNNRFSIYENENRNLNDFFYGKDSLSICLVRARNSCETNEKKKKMEEKWSEITKSNRMQHQKLNKLHHLHRVYQHQLLLLLLWHYHWPLQIKLNAVCWSCVHKWNNFCHLKWITKYYTIIIQIKVKEKKKSFVCLHCV